MSSRLNLSVFSLSFEAKIKKLKSDTSKIIVSCIQINNILSRLDYGRILSNSIYSLVGLTW